jgi:ribosome-binding protein aMBF1 (putative translation factor)
MVDHPKPELPEQIACEICMKEVPKTEALNAEGAEYVLYFCGLDCYRKWSGDQPGQSDDASAAGKPHVHTARKP